MLKKIDILGMQIDNYTVREAIMQTEVFLGSGGMNTIETVTMKMLDMAATEPCIRECMQMLDLTVIGEKEILVAAGIRSNQRIRETVEHTFFEEFMKRIVRNRKSVFLLGETRSELDDLASYLERKYEKLTLAGSYALEENVGDVEGVVNEINSTSVDVILSVIPSPQQEQFLLENKGKLDAGIWYGIGKGYETHSGFARLMTVAGQLIHKKRLQQRQHKYENENEEE